MKKKSYTSRTRRSRHQKAHAKQFNQRARKKAPYQQRAHQSGNNGHWFGKLPPNHQCIMVLSLMALVGIIAHDHTVSSDLFNILTQILYMLR